MFGKNYFCQLILLFSLFLLLFMSPIALFDTIYGSHCTISANFYLYLLYFQQKVFSFNKISWCQTDPKYKFFFFLKRKKKKKENREFTQNIAWENREDLEDADHVVKVKETNRLEQTIGGRKKTFLVLSLRKKEKNIETIIEEENYYSRIKLES